MNEQMEAPRSPKPKGRVRLGRALAALVVVTAVGAGVGYRVGLFGTGEGGKATAGRGEKYTCGMHPWIISDKPGSCPICGMKLTKIEPQQAAPAASANTSKEAEDFFAGKPSAAPKGPRKILYYRNPMNPSVTSPVPMKDEMGMDYVPVYADEVQAPAGGTPEGLATVRVGEEALRLSGVQTAAATLDTVGRSVRTVGTVVPDETRVRHVHTKIEGWVEKLHINFMGQVVRQGQPILSIYAPELLSTQEEYLRARDTAAKFDKSPSPDVRRLGEELLKSARRRLELFDVPSSFISQLARTGKVQRAVTLVAPVSGFVTGKEIFEGQKVEPGMELFNVTDLSRVWIEADLYEYEASAVKVGQRATLSLAYEPGVELQGKVAYVLPFLTPESRTLKVRFEFPNPKLTLKPQMYADVKLDLEARQGVTIPDSALIDTGVRKVAFVEVAQGTFEPREVKVGVRGDGKAQIVSGVRPGEKVVVKANFLLDSESRLRAALNKMTGAAAQPQKIEQSGGAGRGAPPAAPGTGSHAGHGG